MAETKTNPEPPDEPEGPDETEAKFWETFENHLDTWFDKKVEKYRSTSTARTGRTTLPEIMANLVFGPKKD